MAWAIPDIPNLFSKPVRSKWNRISVWLAGLGLLYLLITPSVWLLWSGSSDSVLFWLLLLLSPLLIWFGTWLTFFIWTMNREMSLKAWEQEKIKIRQRWIDWAQKTIAVVGSDLLLPDDIDVEGILTGRGKVLMGSASVFERNDELPDSLSEIYTAFWAESLPLFKQAKKSTIYIEESSETDFLEWQNRLRSIAEQSGVLQQAEMAFVQVSSGLGLIADWMENGISEGVHVIFSAALNDDADSPDITENMSWTAFASHDWAKKHTLPVKMLMQRPTSFNLSDKEGALSALSQFVDYGLKGRTVKTLWPAGMEEGKAGKLSGYMGKVKLELSHEDNNIAMHLPEKYIGNVPPNMPLLVLALSSENINYQDKQLLAWQAGEDEVCLTYVYMDNPSPSPIA
ncbi:MULTISPECIES: hypothetical protein [unclassified Neisseria]|uniref:hypothetical protein n=1 Tax=unclassified Neisseria TaxID=2623750 RepID=UPI002665ABFA|nr:MULTISPECIES: hypothetical protein [unclassified Neisseria]MDO1509197.1 hypothetical protein [Neisseria sp. MVDL19-042950]MDO1515524.1 hypothetical protein [Neisseria sp. MVDL18-041461]MDO1562883.1 hypothetical protein [Neisseria sp. MVDL20-010259]